MKTAKEYLTSSENETFSLAEKMAKSFRGTEVVLLSGELGAGKTVFVKGIAAGLDIEEVHQVCSPSYTLINIYQAKYPLYHIDLYRLGRTSEIEDLGWEDFLDRGVIVVEWAEKLDFPLEAIRVEIKVMENHIRKIRMSADSRTSMTVFP
ncbi:MAG: tRNA (adenosine(37)-N6)-threonylcarbamoyltransferase complex ATPase subunit type 1 TsaE [Candidatus Aminicenantes bacterium]|jgi:tRNA threonylcarbamoyladenosine biosynthesis protein TsaE